MICQLHPSVHGHCWDIFLLWKMVIATTKIQKTLLWKGKCRYMTSSCMPAGGLKCLRLQINSCTKTTSYFFSAGNARWVRWPDIDSETISSCPAVPIALPVQKNEIVFFLKVSAKNKWRFQVCIYFWSATFQNQIPRSWFFSTLQPDSAACLKSQRPPQSDYSCKIISRKSSKNRNHQVVESTLKLNVQLQTSPARPCLLVFAFANSYLALADDPHHTRTLSQIWIVKKEMMHSGSFEEDTPWCRLWRWKPRIEERR